MPACLFASDLHGSEHRARALLLALEELRPAGMFLGGDLLPGGAGFHSADRDFLLDLLLPGLRGIRARLGGEYPRLFVILGNDDGRIEEDVVRAAEAEGIWEYVHGRRCVWGSTPVLGYAYVPPTPFMLKDWERYDVSHYLDPGCVSPEEGSRSVPVPIEEARDATIQADLQRLAGEGPVDLAVFLFHAPPYQTKLDRAGLDGRSHEGAPLDVHVGSIAIRRFIEARQPLLTLHGHVHESVRLTGHFKDSIGKTVCLSAAHDGPELALVRFRLSDPGSASRELR